MNGEPQKSVIRLEKFYLLQSAQSLIDVTIKELLKKYQAETQNGEAIKAKRGEIDQRHKEALQGTKILKFKNQEAYLYGDTQLIYFSDVREHLKTGLPIELVLINDERDQLDARRKSTVVGDRSSGYQRQGTKLSKPNQNVEGVVPLSTSNQAKLFPPIMNTMLIETEVEQQMREQNQKLPMTHAQLENQIKTRITDIYNSTSKFFWYPPKELLTEQTFRDREYAFKNQKFPGFGISYTKSSLPQAI